MSPAAIGAWGAGKMLTLDSALLNARYLHVLMRHSDKVEIACRSNLANSYAGAIIETSPSGLLKRPSYYVMQLYARHAKPVPLRLEQSDDAAGPLRLRLARREVALPLRAQPGNGAGRVLLSL